MLWYTNYTNSLFQVMCIKYSRKLSLTWVKTITEAFIIIDIVTPFAFITTCSCFAINSLVSGFPAFSLTHPYNVTTCWRILFICNHFMGGLFFTVVIILVVIFRIPWNCITFIRAWNKKNISIEAHNLLWFDHGFGATRRISKIGLIR